MGVYTKAAFSRKSLPVYSCERNLRQSWGKYVTCVYTDMALKRIDIKYLIRKISNKMSVQQTIYTAAVDCCYICQLYAFIPAMRFLGRFSENEKGCCQRNCRRTQVLEPRTMVIPHAFYSRQKFSVKPFSVREYFRMFTL